ncbi:hypothetical protein AX774_g741 [Zancudomyces culisetae]|uniref:Uncharacterized protein n=1 Tax=Zancudomyces culisetae TaxID=1213189 RepID=A0A1R1PXK5_ZANCU|nr:hypothetical protein AX774_g741 [Zancudomyces culisetae]|eukprot:OMH85711.1 hypothetical protein AX774_g741 [Zancudomyces culisetae]
MSWFFNIDLATASLLSEYVMGFPSVNKFSDVPSVDEIVRFIFFSFTISISVFPPIAHIILPQFASSP